jgi:hypothetical protein
MRPHRLGFLRRQAGRRDHLLALQTRLDLVEHDLFRFGRSAPQARLHHLQILQDQVEAAFRRHDDGVGRQRLVLADDVHQGVDFFLRFDQLVSLVQARVFDFVFSQRNAGEAD